MKKLIALTICVAFLLEAAMWAGLGSDQTMYVGGTVNTIKEGTEGKSSAKDEKVFVFGYSGGKLEIPYDRVNDLEYGQTGLEKTSQELHSYKEGTAAGGVGGSFSGNTGSVVGRSAAIEDSSTSTETIHEARVAVRLVDRDGDVIWSSTQESRGGKYKGASADVADKVVKQLLRDLDKIEKKRDQPVSPVKPK